MCAGAAGAVQASAGAGTAERSALPAFARGLCVRPLAAQCPGARLGGRAAHHSTTNAPASPRHAAKAGHSAELPGTQLQPAAGGIRACRPVGNAAPALIRRSQIGGAEGVGRGAWGAGRGGEGTGRGACGARVVERRRAMGVTGLPICVCGDLQAGAGEDAGGTGPGPSRVPPAADSRAR